MGFDPNEPQQRRQLREAMKAADITVGELWLQSEIRGTDEEQSNAPRPLDAGE